MKLLQVGVLRKNEYQDFQNMRQTLWALLQFSNIPLRTEKEINLALVEYSSMSPFMVRAGILQRKLVLFLFTIFPLFLHKSLYLSPIVPENLGRTVQR